MSDLWTRRKEAVAAEARAETAAHDAAAQAEVAAAEADLSDADMLEKYDLPDPETLGEGDNFRPFLRDAIPQRLKSRALRRLWRVNPVLANLDGLVDYGEDFTDAATVVDGLTTAYQVGKGMLAHLTAKAEQADEVDDVDDGDMPADAPRVVTEEAPKGADEGPIQVAPADIQEAPVWAEAPPPEGVREHLPRRPRITFAPHPEESA